ncbi:MAG: hypothetical protein ACE5G0_19450 [Rhodothermales bacterium]
MNQPPPHDITVEHARAFLLECGVTEETLEPMEAEEIMAHVQDLYRRKMELGPGGRMLFATLRWILFFTPLRWGWERLATQYWALSRKGPFLLMSFQLPGDEAT